jgi:hypothetical protein
MQRSAALLRFQKKLIETLNAEKSYGFNEILDHVVKKREKFSLLMALVVLARLTYTRNCWLRFVPLAKLLLRPQLLVLQRP